MKSLKIGAALLFCTFSTSHACEELKTTEAIVNYVCDYALVSNTQCKVWKEDMRQMNYNNQVIINSFISWNKELEESKNLVAEH